MEWGGAAAAGAAIQALEADAAVWEGQLAVLDRVVGQGRAGQHLAWQSAASREYAAALDRWIRDGTGLVAAAEQVVAALRTHISALQEAQDALAAVEALAVDPLGGSGLLVDLPGGGLR